MTEPSKENKAKALAIVDFIMVTLEGKGAFYLILVPPEAKEKVITVSNIQNDDDITELLQRAKTTEMR